ncbi:electron transport complex subunit RsxB [Neisseriaceae bacterium TC5R-5]|nr:electron transport complex subunit RsxB [Neisseriaceae bacterium TC5R-5]
MSIIPLVEKINALLPQTQCGQCGHPGCRPYAEALAEGNNPINRCPPGGEDGIQALAQLLNTPPIPFAPDGPQPKKRALAVIQEDFCIGCTLCIQACPVDAILGTAKHMHTVIASECTGCELCLPTCPVDCIELVTVDDPADSQRSYVLARAELALNRYTQRQQRLTQEQMAKAKRLAERTQAKTLVADSKQPAIAAIAASPASPAGSPTPTDKQAVIRAAMERAAALRHQSNKDKQ